MAIFQGPSRTCPNCGDALNCAQEADALPSRPPQPGDITICAYCAAVLIFTDTALRLASVDDLADLPTEMQQLVARGRAFFQRRHA